MKLAYLLNQRMPTEKAYGIQVMEMCRAFASQGAHVELVIPTRNARLGTDVFAHYRVDRTFSVQRLRAPDFYWPGFLDRLAFVIKQAISAVVLVWHALKARPDLIYTRDEGVAWLLSFFTRHLIFEAHTFSPRRAIWYRRIRNAGIRVVAISEMLRLEFIRFGWYPELVLVAHDGVDLEAFAQTIEKDVARKRLGLSGDRPIVMYTGHLFAWKGADVLAQAASSLNDMHIVFVGGMPDDVERFQKRFGRLPNITIIGQRPHGEIPQYLAAADVLVLPNSAKEVISRSYTSPLKLFEYMASRRPIVASNLDSIREVLNDGNAVLVEADNHQALAEGIKKAVRGNSQPRMEKAYQDVQAMTWSVRAKSILGFFRKKMIAFLTHDIDPRGGWGRFASDLISGAKDQGYGTLILKEREDGREGVALIRRGKRMFSAAWRTLRYLRAADIVHALDVYPYGIIAWLAMRLVSRPLILTLQGTYSVAPFANRKTAWLARRVVKQARIVTAISRFTADQVKKHSGRKDIAIINHGIDMNQFSRERKPSHRKFILSVGALKFRKGYHISIPAFARAQQELSDLEYVIVGNQRDQAYFQKLRQLAKDDGVSDRIHFVTDISDAELADYYASAQAFVLPSVNQGSHVEGFGLVFLEAAAAGLPVIGTRGNGIEDAVKDGYNGILVPQHNIEALAKAISGIVGDPRRQQQMSQASFAWAKQHDVASMTAQYISRYKQL